jgi:hypothetical protein
MIGGRSSRQTSCKLQQQMLLLAVTAIIAMVAGALANISTDDRCATKRLDLLCLRRQKSDYFRAINSPCSAFGCDGPSMMSPGHLPWNLYFNFCGPTIIKKGNCNGSAVCQTWPGPNNNNNAELSLQSASLGASSTCVFADVASNAVSYKCTGGTPAPAGGQPNVARSLSIAITCPVDGKSESAPRFVYADTNVWEYSFEWKHVAACGACGKKDFWMDNEPLWLCIVVGAAAFVCGICVATLICCLTRRKTSRSGYRPIVSSPSVQ